MVTIVKNPFIYIFYEINFYEITSKNQNSTLLRILRHLYKKCPVAQIKNNCHQ